MQALVGAGSIALGLSVGHVQNVRAAENQAMEEVAEIIVTGTRIRGVEQPVGSAVVAVDRQQIEALSATNFADVLSQVTVVNSFNTQPRISDVGSGSSTAPGLRGLPATATIFLLNGNRMVGDNPLATSPDPSSIPAAAIERIEIVPDGNSAIYGSDAVGGVVNIITRKDFDGIQVSGRYGSAQDYDAFDASGITGFRWDGGSAIVAASYFGHGNLLNSERDFFTADKSAFGGADNRERNCFPSNVTVGTTTYAPPDYAPGVVRCSNQADADILSDDRRFTILGSIEHDVNDRLRLFGDAKYTDTASEQNRPFLTSPVTISNTNPFFQAPPGTGATTVNVLYNLRGIFPESIEYTYDTESAKLTAGGELQFGTDWAAMLTGSYGRSESSANNPRLNPTALAAAAAGTTPTTALDPFGSRTAQSVIDAIGDFRQYFTAKQQLYEAILQADGSLFALPGGDVKVAIGGSYRTEKYEASTLIGSSTAATVSFADADVNIAAAFAELLIPVVGASNDVPLIHSLQLSAAARYDDYSNFGDTTNPKFGITWEIVDGLSLRASKGKSFRAPTLADTQGSDSKVQFIPNLALVAPGGTAPANTLLLAGSNPDLQPETADTYSLGLDLRLPQLPGFDFSVSYYNVDFSGQIGSPITLGFPFPLFTDPALASTYIVVNPTPAQVQAAICCVPHDGFPAVLPSIGQIVDLRRYNLSETKTEGYDFAANYRINTARGSWHAGLSGTRTMEYAIRASENSAPTDFFKGGNSGIRWRLRGELNWHSGAASAGVAYNYTDSYKLSFATTAGTPGVQTVDSYGLANVYASYKLPFRSLGAETTLSLNVDNVLDEDPPLVLGNLIGFDVTRTNPIGRMYWLGVQVHW